MQYRLRRTLCCRAYTVMCEEVGRMCEELPRVLPHAMVLTPGLNSKVRGPAGRPPAGLPKGRGKPCSLLLLEENWANTTDLPPTRYRSGRPFSPRRSFSPRSFLLLLEEAIFCVGGVLRGRCSYVRLLRFLLVQQLNELGWRWVGLCSIQQLQVVLRGSKISEDKEVLQ